MGKRIDRVLAYVQRTPWAILASQGQVIAAILSRRASGVRLSRREIKARIEDRRAEVQAHEVHAAALSRDSGGMVQVIPLVGTVMHRAGGMDDMSGIASTQTLVKRVRQADADPDVRAIVLDVDSPGGTVEGVVEAAAALRASSTPIIAVANTMAASAGYWLASQADELVVSPSGEVGSIGVYSMHTDVSEALAQEGVKVTLIRAGKFKAENSPFEPLSEDAQAAMQAEVTDFYEMFVKDVAKGRGVKTSAVRGGFGQGRMLRAKAAVAEGMADRVETLEAAVKRAASGRVKKRGALADANPIGAVTALVDDQVELDEDLVDDATAQLEEPVAAAADLDEIEIRERELGL